MDSRNTALSDANDATTKCVENGCQLGLLQMPHEILEKILTYLTFDEISICRQACKPLNSLASSSLNSGFTKADRLHATIQREVKAKLPRRESERRNHPLARHVDILSAIETRLSLLSMTYSKYIDLRLCCFIPGKVLDEIYRILKSVRVSPNPPRAHELLQELRDISSMAMEHFDEKIAPKLRDQMPEASGLRLILSSGSGAANRSSASYSFRFRANSAVSLARTLPSGITQRQLSQLRKLRQRQFCQLRDQLQQSRAEMRRRIAGRDRQIVEMSRKIAEQDRTLGELNRRIVEYDQRFDDILAEVTRVRAAEDLRVKPKRIPPADAPSTSSAGEILPKQSAEIPGSENGTECKSLLASASVQDHSCPVSGTVTESRKRKGYPPVHQAKHSRTESSTVAGDMRRLRSSRQVPYM